MEKHIIELVVYKIKSEETEKYTTEIINSFRKLVMSFDGFISYHFLQSCQDNQMFMDFVLWDSLKMLKWPQKKLKRYKKVMILKII